MGADDLRWLAPILSSDASSSSADPDAADLEAAGWLVLPSRTRPWVVLCDTGLRGNLQALRATGLKSRRERFIRMIAIGAVLVRAVSGPVRGRRPYPVAPSGLLASLIHDLDDCASAVVIVGKQDANRKPTLQLFDGRGQVMGYAKVGWDNATRALVGREIWALTLLAERPPGDHDIAYPTLMLAKSYGDLCVVATRPMPHGCRPWPSRSPAPRDLMDSICKALGGSSGLRRVEFHDAATWTALRAGLAGVAEILTPEVTILSRALERVLTPVPQDVRLEVGGWHGDLTPWNLALRDRQEWVWDWEHAGQDRPLGFDALHFHFGSLRHIQQVTTADAVDSLCHNATDILAPHGIDPRAMESLVLGYLIERWLRAYELYAMHGTWDEAIHPAVVEIVDQRWGPPGR